MKKTDKSKSVSNAYFSRLMDAVCFAGGFGVVISLCGVIGTNYEGAAVVVLVLLALYTYGYMLQLAWSKIRGIKRVESSDGYEQGKKLYKPVKAAPVIILGVITAYLIDIGVDSLLRKSAEQTGGYYDPETILPLLAALAAFPIITFGSYIWFMPYDRLLTGKGCMTCYVVIGIGLCLTPFFAPSESSDGSGLSLFAALINSSVLPVTGAVIYALCSIIAINQHSLGSTFSGNLDSFLTPRVRRYNFMLTLVLIASIFLIYGVIFISVSAINTIILITVASLLLTTGGSTGVEEDVDVATQNFTKMVFDTQKPAQSPEYWYLLIFFFMLIIFLWMYLRRNTVYVKMILKKVEQWLYKLLVALFDFDLRFLKNEEKEDTFLNYTDEEERIQEAVIRDTKRDSASRRSWRDFSADLHMFKTPESRYRFAYRELVSWMRRENLVINKSATPRELAVRLKKRGKFAPDDIDAVTRAYENTVYAGKPVDSEAERAYSKLLDMLRDALA